MADFTFTQISNSSELYSVFKNPSINDAGKVAFENFTSVESPPTAISSGIGNGPVTTIADTSSGYNIFFSPSINNAGMTVFAASRYLPETGVLTGSGNGLATTVADSSGPFTLTDTVTGQGAIGEFVSAPGINNPRFAKTHVFQRNPVFNA